MQALATTGTLVCAWIICLFMISCDTPRPPMKERLPYGSAGTGVNTRYDEVAPQLVAGTSALLFTRDSARTSENTQSRLQRLFLSGRTPKGWDSARSVLQDAWMAYDNNVGATVSDSAAPVFFSATHIPTKPSPADSGTVEFLSGGCGGADIFASVAGKGSSLFGRNLGDTVNSRYWDAHPALAYRGADSVLLIFASDRPVIEGATSIYAHGFSMPFINQQYDISFDADPVRKGRSVRRGNADLYYAFCIRGVWSPVKNMNDVRGLRDSINTEESEYSPFVYCPTGNPVLYFSSHGHQGRDSAAPPSGNIYSACLSVDFATQRLSVRTFAQLPVGADSVNTPDSDERFPSVYADSSRMWIAFSSDRDTAGKRIDTLTQPGTPQRIISRGGYDVYQMPLSQQPCPCAAPPPAVAREPEGEVYYDVVLLDRTNPTRVVRQPSIIIVDSTASETVPVRDGHARIAMKDGHRYAAFGSSSYSASCETSANADVIGYTGYARDIAVRHVPVRALRYDTVLVDADTIRDIVTEYDTLRLGPAVQAVSAPSPVSKTPNTSMTSSGSTNGGGRTMSADGSEQRTSDTLTRENTTRPTVVQRDQCTTVITLPKKTTERIITARKDAATKSAASPSTAASTAPAPETITLSSRFAIRKREVVRTRVEGGKAMIREEAITVDSAYEESTYRLVGVDTAAGASVRTLTSGIPDARTMRVNGRTTVIYDTVYVEPILAVKCPPVEKIATTNLFGIPYYQTCYWKVNTVQGLENVLQEMNTGSGWQGTSRRFVELHENNKYWGRNDSVLRQKRIEMFRFFAVQVDKTFDSLADNVDKSLAVFMANKNSMKDSTHRRKFVIDLTAWSDKRPIEVARYFDAGVRFVADYSQAAGAQRCLGSSVRMIDIQQNADLSGKDNTRLSNLRAYYSYKDFLERLLRLPTFSRVVRRGQVALPDATDTLSAYLRMVDSSDVVFLIRGSSVYSQSRDTVISEEHGRKREDLIRRVRDIPASAMSVGTNKSNLNEALRLDFNRWDSIVVSTYDYEGNCLVPEKPCQCSGYVDRSQALFGLRSDADKRKVKQPGRRRNGTY